jgi:hypothetical protein
MLPLGPVTNSSNSLNSDIDACDIVNFSNCVDQENDEENDEEEEYNQNSNTSEMRGCEWRLSSSSHTFIPLQ